MRKSASSILVLAATLLLCPGIASAASGTSDSANPQMAVTSGSSSGADAAGSPSGTSATVETKENASDIPVYKGPADNGPQMEVIMVPPASSTLLKTGTQKKVHKHPILTYTTSQLGALGYSLYWFAGPDSEDKDPFQNFKKLTPMQKRVFHITWNDGSSTLVNPTPNGGFTLVGGDNSGTKLEPIESGGFLVISKEGRAGKLLPLPGGGFQLTCSGGDTVTVKSSPDGGFYIDSAQNGELGAMIPGPGGTKYGFFDNSFFQ